MTNVIKDELDQFKDNMQKLHRFLVKVRSESCTMIPDPGYDLAKKFRVRPNPDDQISTGVSGYGTVHTHGNGARESDCNCLETTLVYLPS
jgi:hypothetical protein